MDRSDVLAQVAAIAEKWTEPEEQERRDRVRRDWPELAAGLDRLKEAARSPTGDEAGDPPDGGA